MQKLLSQEGLAIGALCLSGIGLMGSDHNGIQSAVIRIGAMVRTFFYRTTDALIRFTIHFSFLRIKDLAFPPVIIFSEER